MINNRYIEIVKFDDGKYGIRHIDKYGVVSFYDKQGYWWVMGGASYRQFYNDCRYRTLEDAKKYYDLFVDAGKPIIDAGKPIIDVEKTPPPKKSFINILLERLFKKSG